MDERDDDDDVSPTDDASSSREGVSVAARFGWLVLVCAVLGGLWLYAAYRERGGSFEAVFMSCDEARGRTDHAWDELEAILARPGEDPRALERIRAMRRGGLPRRGDRDITTSAAADEVGERVFAAYEREVDICRRARPFAIESADLHEILPRRFPNDPTKLVFLDGGVDQAR